MRPWAKRFYESQAWRNTRQAYMKKAGGLCEMCLKKGLYTPAEIIHHKEWLTESNINDPRITLSFSNLMAVCRLCHEEIHHEANTDAKHRKYEKRYTLNQKTGRVTGNG